MSNIVLELRNVTKLYQQGGRELHVLDAFNLTINTGEIVALVGPSGSGKSTLLQIAGLLDAPTSGDVLIAGKAMTGAADGARTVMRRDHIGFIYQFHNLLPEFSALENVVIPQMIAGGSQKMATAKALELLEALGLKERVEHRPAALSGGEQQRVAIARALANAPQLVLADEPTGNLDPATSAQVFDLLLAQARQAGVGMLIATHNMQLAARMDRQIKL